MAIALDAVSATNTHANSNAAKTAALVLGGGLNRVVIAGVGLTNSGGYSPAPTFNGVTMTLIDEESNASTFYGKMYYLLEASLPAAGTYNLSVDPVTAGYGGIWCLSLTGVKQQAPEVTAKANGISTGWTTNITTLTDNAWIIDAVFSADTTYTPAAGQTERFDFKDGTSTANAASTKPVAVAGATSMGWTPAANKNYTHILAAFAAAAVAGSEGVILWS